jgi:uncharacterized protein (TIGR02145 family)
LANTIGLTTADTNITADWTLPQIDSSTTGQQYYDTPHLYALVDGQYGFSPDKPNSEEVDINSQYFAGYYYNWCAATAGTIDTTCAPMDGISIPSDATQDICPANWRMPKGGQWDDITNDFAQLNIAMFGDPGLTTSSNYDDQAHLANFLFSGPFRGILAGFHSGWWDVQIGGENGVWSASSTTGYPHYSSQYAYGLTLVSVYSYFVLPGNQIYGRYFSLPVRCLLD